MGNEVAVQKKQGIAAFLASDSVKQKIMNVVGEKESQSFISSVVSAVQTNPDLAKCTNQSIFSAALLGHSLRLPPSPQLGFFYMVPYKNSEKSKKQGTDVYEAQFQISYKGLYQLAMRSGNYKKVVATPIKEGELVEYNPITHDITFHAELDSTKRASLPSIGYYAEFTLVNGAKQFVYWSKEEMEAHAEKYSAMYRSDLKWNNSKSFWKKDFDFMATKTILKQLISKWGMLSVEMTTAIETDQAVIGENGEKYYIDNVPDEPTPAIDVETDVDVVEIEAEDVTNAD